MLADESASGSVASLDVVAQCCFHGSWISLGEFGSDQLKCAGIESILTGYMTGYDTHQDSGEFAFKFIIDCIYLFLVGVLLKPCLRVRAGLYTKLSTKTLLERAVMQLKYDEKMQLSLLGVSR